MSSLSSSDAASVSPLHFRPEPASRDLPTATPAPSTKAKLRNGDSKSPLRPQAQSSHNAGEVLAALFTTSACLHLLITGITGFGVHSEPLRLRKTDSIAPAPIIEDVKLETPPPEKLEEPPKPLAEPDLNIAAPAPLADIDLPPLPDTTPISAVSADVPVAFAIAVKGPVRIVKDASSASGTVGGRPQAGVPLSVNAGAANAGFLVPPNLPYPTAALQRHIQGVVEIEFKTTPTGEIYDAKVRSSSGSGDLDRAALQNIRRARWTGQAGYWARTYNFVLN